MKYETPADVPDAVVERMKSQGTYVRMAKRRAQERKVDLSALTDDDWRQIYWDKSKQRSAYYQKKKVEELAEQQEETAPPARPSISIDDYLDYYADPAPNDLVTIEQLISMQHQLDTIKNQIAVELDQDEINTSRWGALVKMQKELSQETRLLQENLGISRRSREARKHEQEIADNLKENIKQARELIDDYGIKLVCPYCEPEGKRIMNGFVIHHFPEMGLRVTTRCPTCQREYAISRSPQKWERQLERTR